MDGALQFWRILFEPVISRECSYQKDQKKFEMCWSLSMVTKGKKQLSKHIKSLVMG